MEALKEMPGYKATLKAVLKAQIQMLVSMKSSFLWSICQMLEIPYLFSCEMGLSSL